MEVLIGEISLWGALEGGRKGGGLNFQGTGLVRVKRGLVLDPLRDTNSY